MRHRVLLRRTVLAAATITAFGLLASVPLQAETPTLEGHWEGAIEIPSQKLEIILDFSLEEGSWKGEISIPVQGAEDLPLDKITVEGREASFAIAGVPGEPVFHGALAEDGKSLAGDFTQGGQTFPFSVTSGLDPAAGAAAELEGIDAVIRAALDDWKTPGLALAVVVDGTVVHAEGYGYRDLENEIPVTPGTLFAIGSSTKAFTTFVMGTLVDEGKLDWDEPVASYLSDFKLYDEYATAHLTPRDMVCHRSGLPRHDLVWYNNEKLTRADLVRRLRHLEPNEDLRAAWQYNNLMFLTAGYLIEQLAGTTWEEAVRSRVLEPLGMRRTNFSVFDSQKDDDHALPYLEEDDELRKIAFRPIGNMGPAGSINSCVEEMAQWIRLQLGGGSIDGKRIIQAGTLREMHTPQMVIPGLPQEDWISPSSYGLGWFVNTWRGHHRVQHGGNIDGFSALVTLFPRDDLGVVVLVNKNASALPGLVTATVADRVLGLEPRNWITEAAKKRDAAKQFEKEGEEKKAMFRVEGTKPSRDLADFAGEFENPGYGVVEIRAEDGGLVLLYNGMTMPLEHWHYDVFNVEERKEEVIPEDLRVNFLTDARGRVSRLTLPFEPFVEPIEFERVPPRRMHDPAFLARLAGAYELPNQTLLISVQGDTLVARTEGGPTVELVPSGEDEFELKTISGISLKFVIGKEGPATEVLAIQSDGVYTAPRKTVEEEK